MEADSPSGESALKHKATALHAIASGPIAASAAKLSGRSRGIPSDRDFHFYNNFPEFKTPVREIIAKSEASLRTLAASDHLLGRKKPPPFPDDLDEAFDWLVNLNDEFLERFGVSMDEFKSWREKEEEIGGRIGAEDAESGFQLVYGKKKRGGMRDYEKDEGFPASRSSLGVKVAMKDSKTTAARSKVPFHIPTIPRPQDEYNILVNNKNQPFEHVWLEKSDDGSRFVHPLEKLSVLDFVDRNVGEGEPVKPLSLENTPFKLVEEVKELKELASKLKGVAEFAVDLEHNQYRSFQGMTCLMQISTRTEDFVIDTLKLRIHVGPYLREVFKDPLKRKVMHGADRDIVWLQRDFAIYVCNLFDTGQASRVLQMERNSLEYLLHHFCGVTANKEYQNAEWRLRPLPGEMLKYAREDTHYLLHIYDLMKIRLLSVSTSESDLLLEVHKRSNEICLQLYEKELLTDTSYQHIYGLQEAEFNSKQLAIVAGLCHWRDTVARAEDESTGYILPNKALLEIARQMPLSSGKLRQLVKSKHPFVERYLSSVIGIIRSSIAGSSAFESIAEQLKNRRREASTLQSEEAVGYKKEMLPSTEDPMESTVSQEDSIGSATMTSIAQNADSAPVHIASGNDCCTPANSGQLTTQVSLNSGIQQKQKLETISVSASGESLTISDMKGTMDTEKMGNGSFQPVRKEKMASVQILKRPTAFGALFGNSSGRKVDPFRGVTTEQESQTKVEKIKSAVILPFHYFSGGEKPPQKGPEVKMIPPPPESLQHGQHNESTELTKMEEVILLENELQYSNLSEETPMTDDDTKHRQRFPWLNENVTSGCLQQEPDSMDMPVSPSELSSSFEKCFQSINERRNSQHNRRSPVEPEVNFQLRPFDYAAARKNIKFGERGEEDVAKGDDQVTSGDSVDNKSKRGGFGKAQRKEQERSFSQPRRRQAFPQSGNRSTTYH
ncbi:protein RRP6-like 2 [Typha latifolia]|uniref:protein RRP6-like 2 n=1 Tax=Typha latifolia TaxID=4733 RepID=UPI003C2F6570